MKKANALVVLLVLIPIILVTQCKSKEYPPDYKTTTPILITDIEGNNEDPFLLRAKDGTIYLVWFSERSGNADIYMKTSKDGKIWSEHTVIIKGGGASNFYPSLAQTKDGKFHLTWFCIDAKSKTFSICYTNSDNGRKWSKTQAITPRHKGYNWVPTIVAARDGSIWIAFSSGRTGNKDVFVVQSKDGGKTWQKPIQVTKHKNHDDLPNIAQKPDGSFLVVWTNYVPEKADYLSKTADIYYATSKDGKIWSGPIAITKNDYTDTIPEIFSNLDQSEFFVAWCSPNGTWDLPLSDLKAEPKHLLGSKPGGYSPRVLPLTDTDYLVAWTGSNKKGKQIYSYQIKKPYVCKKEKSVSALYSIPATASAFAETSNNAKLNSLTFVKACQVGREKGLSWDFGRWMRSRSSYLNLIYSKYLR